MSEDASPDETVSVAAWLGRVRSTIGPSAGQELTSTEQEALLEIARIAAHSSERIAAPLTTFLAGVAYGAKAGVEREDALRSLVDDLEG